MSISVTHSEVMGWPRSRWYLGVFEGVRKLKCAWDDRYTLLAEIDSYPDCIWPYDDGPNDAYAREATVEPLTNARQSGSGGIADYEWAVVTVRYSSLGPRVYNNTLIEEWFEPTAEFLNVDYTRLKWDNATTGTHLQPYEGFGKIHASFDYILKIYGTLVVPAWVFGQIGYTNANYVMAPTLGVVFDPQTLLYKPPIVHRTVNRGKLPTFDVTMRFGFHRWGWNKQWRVTNEAWEDVYKDGGGQYYNYPLTNFV